eukprot:jgi/Astpho2/256/Aster-x0428
MSMTGKLKASTNRVRTSTAHNTHSIWTDAVGLQQSGGDNAAVEAGLPAPQFGGGRAARRAAAADIVEKTGGFNTAVEDFSALITLARNQGAIGGQNRGACRICGQLGHLTKQCRNHLSAHFQAPTTAEAAAAAAASGKPLLPSIPAGPQAEDLSDLSSLSSDGSGSESNSESGSVRRKRQHKEKSSKDKKHKHKSKRRKRDSTSSSE